MHRRFAPKAHGFRYGMFLFALDLDELDVLDQHLRLFSVGRANLYSFHDSDYLPVDGTPHNPGTAARPAAGGKFEGQSLKSRVVALLSQHGVDIAGGRVELVTLPRVAGFLFNPVSFYFCYDRTGKCVSAVPEVTNTFREMKPFVLGPECRQAATGSLPPAADGESGAPFRLRVPKYFYVSPFSDVDVAFDFTLRPPGGRLAIQIDDYAGAGRTLTSTLTGRVRPLTDAALFALTLRHPLVPLRTLSLIHWHALRLWLKRVPWFAKAARAADQRDLWRPHASLTAAHPPPLGYAVNPAATTSGPLARHSNVL